MPKPVRTTPRPARAARTVEDAMRELLQKRFPGVKFEVAVGRVAWDDVRVTKDEVAKALGGYCECAQVHKPN